MVRRHNHDSNTPFGFSTLGLKILDPTLKAMKAYKRGPKKCVSRGPPAARNHDSNTPVGFSTLGLKILETSFKSLKAYKLAPKWCFPHRLPPATMIAIPF
jgi:hypothetical protein